jgi:hypothetical protein
MKQLEDFQKMVDDLRPEQPLTEENTMMFMQLMMSKDPKLEELLTTDNEMMQHNEMQVPNIFLSRLQSLSTLKITTGAAIAIFINLSSAGSAVMYAYYLHRKCAPDSTVTLDTITKDLFPWGVISEKQMEELWDAQKLWSAEEEEEAAPLQCYMVKDNLLDYVGTWKELEVEA